MQKRFLLGFTVCALLGLLLLLYLFGTQPKQSDQLPPSPVEVSSTSTKIQIPNTRESSSSSPSSADNTAQGFEPTNRLPLEHELPKYEFSGSVLDGSKDSIPPLQGAKITAYILDDTTSPLKNGEPLPIAEATSAADGSFRFEKLSWNGIGILAYRAEYPDFSSLMKIFPIGEGVDNRALTTFMMYPAGSIEGEVVDQEGKPISRAWVGEVMLEDSVGGQITKAPGTFVSSWATTDANGRFKLSGIPLPIRDPKRPREERKFRLPAVAYGYADAKSEAVTAGRSDVRIVMLKSEARLFGRVFTHDREPVPGTLIKLTNQRPDLLPTIPRTLEAITAEDGTFEFPDLLAGAYNLLAEKEYPESLGFNPLLERRIVLTNRSTANEELVFPAPVTLAGRVMNQEGQGIPDFVFHSKIDEITARSQAPSVTTDESGDFLLSLYVPEVSGAAGFSPRLPITLPGVWRPSLNAQATRIRLDTQDIVFENLQPSQRYEELVVLLEAGSLIKGTAYEPDAKTPLLDASVFLRGTNSFNSVPTSPTGEFEFVVSAGEKVTLEASSVLGAAALEVSAPREDVALILNSYATISGSVLTASGDPLVGLEVRAFRTAEPGRVKDSVRFEEFALTDEQGFYKMENIVPDTMELKVLMATRSELIPPKSRMLSPEPGEQLAEINFVAEQGDFLEGIVVDQQGQGIEGVSLLTPDTRLSADTDAEGRFKIVGVPMDQPIAFVSASKRGFQEETKENVSLYDGELRFEMKPLQRMKVVAETLGGAIVTDYRLQLQKEVSTPRGKEWSLKRDEVVNDKTGTRVLEEISQGAWRVEVVRLDQNGRELAERGSVEFNISSSSTGDDQTIRVILEGGLYLTGRVVGESQQSQSPTTVLLLNLPQNAEIPGAQMEGPPYDRRARVSLESDGTFLMGPLSEGGYTLVAENEYASSARTNVLLRKGTEPIELKLIPSALLVGTILDSGNNAMKSATVFLAYENEPPSSNPEMVEGGSFRLRIPQPGKWRVIVSENGTGKNQTKAIQFAEGETKEEIFRFSDIMILRGTLTQNGAPAEVSNIVFRGTQGQEAYARLTSSGAYEAEVLPGTYQPWLVTMDVEIPVGESFEVPEGTEEPTRDVALTLGQLDLLVEGKSLSSGLEAELLVRTPWGQVTAFQGYSVTRPQQRFAELPVGEYKGTLRVGEDIITTSEWVPVGSGSPATMVMLLPE